MYIAGMTQVFWGSNVSGMNCITISWTVLFEALSTDVHHTNAHTSYSTPCPISWQNIPVCLLNSSFEEHVYMYIYM